MSQIVHILPHIGPIFAPCWPHRGHGVVLATKEVGEHVLGFLFVSRVQSDEIVRVICADCVEGYRVATTRPRL